MDPTVLTVFQSPYPKQRLGKEYDGGYVIAIIPDIKYSILLSGGILDDISFEEDFIEKYNIPCIAYDGTIKALPPSRLNTHIEFVKKNIGDINTDNITNLHTIIENYTDIFIKMDIEGGEIPWINSLDKNHMNRFSQLVIEFHFPFTKLEAAAFAKLNETHVLIHFHGNNCCGVRNHAGVSIPNIFECTYIHKKYFMTAPVLNRDSIPSTLDMKNVQAHDEIYISHPPFVN